MSAGRFTFSNSEKGSQMCSGEKFNGQKGQRFSFLDTGPQCLEESSWLSNLAIMYHVLTGMGVIAPDCFVEASNKVGKATPPTKSSMMTETWHNWVFSRTMISKKHRSWLRNGYRMLELSLPKQLLNAIERDMLKARSMVENQPIYSTYNSAKTSGQKYRR